MISLCGYNRFSDQRSSRSKSDDRETWFVSNRSLTRFDALQLLEIAGLDQTIGQVIATLHKEDSVTYQAIRYQLIDLSAPIHTMVLNTTNYDRGLRLETASARSDSRRKPRGATIQ